jgi:hypothetical protein
VCDYDEIVRPIDENDDVDVRLMNYDTLFIFLCDDDEVDILGEAITDDMYVIMVHV